MYPDMPALVSFAMRYEILTIIAITSTVIMAIRLVSWVVINMVEIDVIVYFYMPSLPLIQFQIQIQKSLLVWIVDTDSIDFRIDFVHFIWSPKLCQSTSFRRTVNS